MVRLVVGHSASPVPSALAWTSAPTASAGMLTPTRLGNAIAAVRCTVLGMHKG